MSADEEAMVPAAAWATIREAAAFEEPLRRRTEGVTWMVWGLVTAAIFATYDALSPAFHEFDHETGVETTAPWYIDALWVYWVLAGALVTWALWRTVALATPVESPPAGKRVTLTWVAAGALGWALALVVLPWLHTHLVPVVAIGVAWLTVGAVNLQRSSPLGRRVLVVVGVVVVTAAVLLDLAAPTPGGDLTLLNAGRLLAAGLPPLLGGLWQALRG